MCVEASLLKQYIRVHLTTPAFHLIVFRRQNVVGEKRFTAALDQINRFYCGLRGHIHTWAVVVMVRMKAIRQMVAIAFG